MHADVRNSACHLPCCSTTAVHSDSYYPSSDGAGCTKQTALALVPRPLIAVCGHLACRGESATSHPSPVAHAWLLAVFDRYGADVRIGGGEVARCGQKRTSGEGGFIHSFIHQAHCTVAAQLR